MTKIQTKRELIEHIQEQRQRLEQDLAKLRPADMTTPGVIGAWSVKDLLAHLFDWEQRFLAWYEAGLRGEKPHIPAEGLKWNQLDLLNQMIFEKHRHRSLEDVREAFNSSYRQILEVVQSIPEEEMFAPGYYAWTGKATLAAFIDPNTGDHYHWADKELRKWMRANKA